MSNSACNHAPPVSDGSIALLNRRRQNNLDDPSNPNRTTSSWGVGEFAGILVRRAGSPQ